MRGCGTVARLGRLTGLDRLGLGKLEGVTGAVGTAAFKSIEMTSSGASLVLVGANEPGLRSTIFSSGISSRPSPAARCSATVSKAERRRSGESQNGTRLGRGISAVIGGSPRGEWCSSGEECASGCVEQNGVFLVKTALNTTLDRLAKTAPHGPRYGFLVLDTWLVCTRAP